MENPPPSLLGSGISIPVAQSISGASQPAANNRQFRLNLTNQNFILVPTNASGNMAITSGATTANVTNLIATHSSNIVNKGKIMIITPNVTGTQQIVGNTEGLVKQTKAIEQPTYQLLTTGPMVSTTNQTITSSKPFAPVALARNAISFNQNKPIPTSKSQSGISHVTTSLITLINSSNQMQQKTAQLPQTHQPHHHHIPNILNGSAHSVGDIVSRYHGKIEMPPPQPCALKPRKQPRILEGPEVISLVDLAEANNLDADMEIEELTSLSSTGPSKFTGHSKQKSTPAGDAKQLLYTDEQLDRESPELWPEQVPGVRDFISGNFPLVDDMEDDPLQEFYPLGGNHGSSNHQGTGISCGDSGLGSGCSDSASVKKYNRTFDFTDYGLASTLPERSRNENGGASDTERESPSSINCESNENSNRASPVEGFANQATSVDMLVPSTPATISASQLKGPVQNAQAPKAKATVKSAPPPEWQRDLDEDEIAMLYGYGSLTTSALLDKVKEIQNLAYQLGLEEEREMTRARFLNILGHCPVSEAPCGGLLLSKNDLVFVETKTAASVEHSAESEFADRPVQNGLSQNSTNLASSKKKIAK